MRTKGLKVSETRMLSYDFASVCFQTELTRAQLSVPVHAEGVTVGETSTLYYDRSKGSLPNTSKLIFKAGLNRWETIQLVDMHRADGKRAEGLPQGNGADWWSVDVTMPEVTHIIIYRKHWG